MMNRDEWIAVMAVSVVMALAILVVAVVLAEVAG